MCFNVQILHHTTHPVQTPWRYCFYSQKLDLQQQPEGRSQLPIQFQFNSLYLAKMGGWNQICLFDLVSCPLNCRLILPSSTSLSQCNWPSPDPAVRQETSFSSCVWVYINNQGSDRLHWTFLSISLSALQSSVLAKLSWGWIKQNVVMECCCTG